MRFFSSARLISLFALLPACGGGTPAAESPATPVEAAQPEATAPRRAVRQRRLPISPSRWRSGRSSTARSVRAATAPSGEGAKGPPVVGLDRGALPLDPPPPRRYRKSQFKTVMDIAEFVVKAMPPNAPGSLSEEEYFSILAFDLKANGIDLGDKKLDAALAKTLEVPRRARGNGLASAPRRKNTAVTTRSQRSR